MPFNPLISNQREANPIVCAPLLKEESEDWVIKKGKADYNECTLI